MTFEFVIKLEPDEAEELARIIRLGARHRFAPADCEEWTQRLADRLDAEAAEAMEDEADRWFAS